MFKIREGMRFIDPLTQTEWIVYLYDDLRKKWVCYKVGDTHPNLFVGFSEEDIQDCLNRGTVG